ncbi:hypothetical protein D9M72_599610 [compost metagenome]
MSQFLGEMAENKLVELVPDPADRRARIVRFAPEAHAIRDDAQKILRDLEAELELAVGAEGLGAMREGLRAFLGGLDERSAAELETA